MLDSGGIRLEVEVPSIGASFENTRNFYSSQEGRIDYTNQAKNIQEQTDQTLDRLNEIASTVADERLDQARQKLESATSAQSNQGDPEAAKQAMDDVQEARRLLAQTRNSHRREIRQLDLDKTIGVFDSVVRGMARPTEVSSFDNLARTAQRSIDNGSSDFESLLDDLRGRVAAILWRQDGFVIDRFRWMSQEPHLFPDQEKHAELVAEGTAALNADDMDTLRAVVARLDGERIGAGPEDDMLASANILRS